MSRVTRVTVMGLLLGCIVAGCGDDDSPPPSVDYVLYAGVGPGGWIARFDCSGDSLVDSLGYAGMDTPEDIYGSPSGKYIATTESGRPTRVWDVRTGTQVGMLQSPSQVVFLEEKNLLIATTGDSLMVYSLPTFALDTAISIRLWNPIRLGDTVLAVQVGGPEGVHADYSQLAVFDINTLELVDSIRVEAGTGFVDFVRVEPSRDGSVLYLLGGDPESPAVYAYSVRERGIIFRKSLQSGLGHLRLSPDERELWVADPGSSVPIGFPWRGSIHILDATTGDVLKTFHTFGLNGSPSDPAWPIYDVQFVPDLDKAYVSGLWGRPILVVDTKTREITHNLLNDEGRDSPGVVVLPRY